MNGWQAQKLGDLVEILSGFAFDSAGFNATEGVPIVRIRDVVPGVSKTRYSGDYDSTFLVQDGDILIGMDGEFNAARWRGGEALLNQRVCCVKGLSGKLDDGYLLHWLPSALQRIEDRTPFVTVKHLSVKTLREVEIKLPPLKEQHRIAAILDQAEALRVKRRRALAKLDTLTQSLFLDLFGDPRTNPKGLSKRPLGDLIKVKSGDSIVVGQLASNGKYPVYGGNGINGYHDTFMFEFPTIVIGRVGIYCGSVHLTDQPSWVTDNALYVERHSSEVKLKYLSAALRFANFNQYAGRAAQPLISGSRIYPVSILVPPTDLQDEFAKRLQSAERLKATQQASQTKLDALFASLQHRAFRGEL